MFLDRSTYEYRPTQQELEAVKARFNEVEGPGTCRYDLPVKPFELFALPLSWSRDVIDQDLEDLFLKKRFNEPRLNTGLNPSAKLYMGRWIWQVEAPSFCLPSVYMNVLASLGIVSETDLELGNLPDKPLLMRLLEHASGSNPDGHMGISYTDFETYINRRLVPQIKLTDAKFWPNYLSNSEEKMKVCAGQIKNVLDNNGVLIDLIDTEAFSNGTLPYVNFGKPSDKLPYHATTITGYIVNEASHMDLQLTDSQFGIQMTSFEHVWKSTLPTGIRIAERI